MSSQSTRNSTVSRLCQSHDQDDGKENVAPRGKAEIKGEDTNKLRVSGVPHPDPNNAEKTLDHGADDLKQFPSEAYYGCEGTVCSHIPILMAFLSTLTGQGDDEQIYQALAANCLEGHVYCDAEDVKRKLCVNLEQCFKQNGALAMACRVVEMRGLVPLEIHNGTGIECNDCCGSVVQPKVCLVVGEDASMARHAAFQFAGRQDAHLRACGRELLMLGISVGFCPADSFHGGRFEGLRLEAFYKSIWTDDLSGAGGCVANAKLFDGAFTVDNLAKVFRAAVAFVKQPEHHWRIDPTAVVLKAQDQRSSALINRKWGANVVYKWRELRKGVAGRATSEPTHYLQYLPGCRLVFLKQGVGWAVSYDYQEGSHELRSSREVLPVLRSLRRYHAYGLVHCDIRAGNCLFGKTNQVGLIGMDWMQPAGSALYPDEPGRRRRVADGDWHPKALPGRRARQSHDRFALTRVLEGYAPAYGATQEQCRRWEAVLDAVYDGGLNDAIILLKTGSDFAMEISDDSWDW